MIGWIRRARAALRLNASLEAELNATGKKLRRETVLRRFWQRQTEHYQEQVSDLQSERATINRQHRAEIERAEQRHDDLLRQVQSMAERIASLRLSGLPEGGGDTFVPATRERAYSDDLTRFLAALESEESRRVVEEQIESLRAQRMDDEQIYEIVREGA